MMPVFPILYGKPLLVLRQDITGVCDYIGTPVIVKPAVSGGSMGLGLKNVVSNDEELRKVIDELYKGYHGWDFTFGGLGGREVYRRS
jgi:D-alanine-D-alanine ligase